MNTLPIFIRVQSEYFESDSSRYRLAITQNTLIQSLRHQTNRDFAIVLKQSPMDPFFTKRVKVFEYPQNRLLNEDDFLESQESRDPRIEIAVGDDDFLCPTFVQNVIAVPLQDRNSFIVFQNGYVFFEGKLHPWRGREDLVQTTMFIFDAQIRNSVLGSQYPSWIYCRHTMNTVVLPSSMMKGAEIKDLKWDGWKQRVVAAYCKTIVITATSNGCTLEPMKSKSVRIAKCSGRTRKFRK